MRNTWLAHHRFGDCVERSVNLSVELAGNAARVIFKGRFSAVSMKNLQVTTGRNAATVEIGPLSLSVLLSLSVSVVPLEKTIEKTGTVNDPYKIENQADPFTTQKASELVWILEHPKVYTGGTNYKNYVSTINRNSKKKCDVCFDENVCLKIFLFFL